MLQEVMDFLKKLGAIKDERPIVEKVGNDVYSVNADRTLGRIVLPAAPPRAPEFGLSTLTGFADACAAKVDGLKAEDTVVVVESFNTVSLVAVNGDSYGRRERWIRAVSDAPSIFRFGEYYEPEKFIITAQAAFKSNDNLEALLALCSNLTAGSTVQVSDDGFSQTVVMSEGGVTRNSANLPPRLGLAPWRTFSEIEPVESNFLVRMRAREKQVPEIALFEVDGGAWKARTALAVKQWMVDNNEGFTVLA